VNLQNARCNNKDKRQFHFVCKYYLKKNSDEEWAFVQISSERINIKVNDMNTTAKYGVWKCVDWELDYIFPFFFPFYCP
jgi:hypothetical protein